MHYKDCIRELATTYNLATTETNVLNKALDILDKTLRNSGNTIDGPAAAKVAARVYFMFTHAHKEHEIFTAMFLNTQHALIATEDLAIGTLDGASVYPREIVKRALHHNAAAVIFAHNHPSGVPTPSNADITLTRQLTSALDLVGVRVIDHIIIGRLESVSFAELFLLD